MKSLSKFKYGEVEGGEIFLNAVDLVWVTPNAEANILKMARVSSPDPENTNTRLINFLIKNRHWSPFEMANMCVKIRTSRAIAQQILRHRSFSFQEFSQRYAEATNSIIYAGRTQAEKDRQSSVDDLDPEVQEWWIQTQQQVLGFASRAYKDAIDKGIAKECARFILPASTETTMYMNGTLRSWIHYLGLRDDPHAQFEHQEIAREIKKLFVENFPVISIALEWWTPDA